MSEALIIVDFQRDFTPPHVTVTVDTSATRAVDARPGDGERALEQLRSLGALVGDLSRPA
jgi:nicotinamidase-related amidase